MALMSLLVANRGEIACRILRTARDLGLRTVAVYSEADAGAPHVAMADEAVLIGPGPAGESYLCGDKIIAAARATGAMAIHPGYGFLSENADFARAVAAAGLVFVGPPATAIEAMGNKAEAKRLMSAAGVPCVPGYEGSAQSEAVLAASALKIGFPVMVKAAAGGGGRGMRLVASQAEIGEAIALARAEAESAFGSGELILEKAIEGARHVEVQVFADAHGNVIHLGERDCSVQRRHQKVIEEAPSPAVTPDLRARMGQAAVEAARAVDYHGAGTVEFLLDAEGNFYFLEMNTRLQVEHPVTEMVTGLDLVALQIAVAGGAPLPLAQQDVCLTGHAIELRLYAEDPSAGFLPSVGRIDLWREASGTGIRVDGGVAQGLKVPPYYDAMLAKIIAYGDTREMARARALRAVEETVLLGVTTNRAFLAAVLALPEFAAGRATTGLLDAAFPGGFPAQAATAEELALGAALMAQADEARAFAAAGYVSRGLLGWSSAPLPAVRLTLRDGVATHDLTLRRDGPVWRIGAGGADIEVRLAPVDAGHLKAEVDGKPLRGAAIATGDRAEVALGARRLRFSRLRAGAAGDGPGPGGRVLAPMPGLLREMLVEEGAPVAKGQTLAILEAMKMQHRIAAPCDGTVRHCKAAPGTQVAAGDLLVEIAETKA